jgi:hypothetical protein
MSIPKPALNVLRCGKLKVQEYSVFTRRTIPSHN